MNTPIISTCFLYVTIGLLLICAYFLLRFKNVHSLLLYSILFSLGATLPNEKTETSLPLLEYFNGRFVVIDDSPSKNVLITKELSTSTRVLLITHKDDTNFIGDSITSKLSFGDTLFVRSILEDISITHFTIKRLVANPNNTYYSKTVDIDSISYYSGQGATIIDRLLLLNRQIEKRLYHLTVDLQDIGIINSLILGNRHKINTKTRSKYNKAGLSHILAISGMHIGIICLILNILFRPIIKSYKGRLFITPIIILLLLSYTFLVGAPISALRATIMFSLVQVSLLRLSSPYQQINNLFATATLFILIDYNSVNDVGFQLSFLAVLSILIYLPIFRTLFSTRNYITDIIFVTISAQLLTYPLVLYYFNGLCTISIINNLLASFFVIFILFIGIAYIIFPCMLFDTMLSYVFRAHNYTLDKLMSIPLSHIEGIDLSIIDCAFYYITLGFFTNYLLSVSKSIKEDAD